MLFINTITFDYITKNSEIKERIVLDDFQNENEIKSKVNNFDLPEGDSWELIGSIQREYHFSDHGWNNYYIDIYLLTDEGIAEYDYFAILITHQIVPGWAISESNDVNNEIEDKATLKAHDSEMELGKYGPVATEGTVGSSTSFSIDASAKAKDDGWETGIDLGFSISSSYTISEVSVNDGSNWATDIFDVKHHFNNGAGNSARSTYNAYPGFIARVPERHSYWQCIPGVTCYKVNPIFYIDYTSKATFSHQFLWFWYFDSTTYDFSIAIYYERW